MLENLEHQLHDPVGYAIPVFLLLIVVELVALKHVGDDQPKTRGYAPRDTAASLSMGLIGAVVAVLFRAVALLGYAAVYVYLAPWHLPANIWWSWVLVILGVDLLWYCYHRMSHRVRLIWAAHQAHHSSEYFNYSTALRQKWNLWFENLMWLPLPLLGVPPWMVYTAFSINLIYQFWVHTEKIGTLPRPIELVFNTPSHHRVHHGSDPEYLDSNYAGILIIWDRMFGTFTAERHRPTYGLTTPVGTYNPLTLQFGAYASLARDLRAARSAPEFLGYLFRPPGWRPSQA